MLDLHKTLCGFCDDAREVYSLERLFEVGGVEYVWQSVIRTCPKDNPTAQRILRELIDREHECKRVIAACLGMM